MHQRSILLSTALLLPALGCASGPPPGTAPSSEPEPSPEAPNASRDAALAPWPADQGIGVMSNGGTYWVVYLPSESEIPLNEEFDVEVRVFDGATRSRLVSAEVTVDARMPAHGHGMKVDAVPTKSADGSYAVPGVLLHMVGHWELYVDMTEGALTERAQFDIELE